LKQNKEKMTTLVNILKKETQTLKSQYISMTQDWASEDFNRLRNFALKYQEGPSAFKNKNEYWYAQRKYYRLPNSILNNNQEQYVADSIKNAEAHYEQSIEKLAARVEKKNLEVSNLKVQTAHVGVNIETVLTGGNKKVSAYTIIAEGEIQTHNRAITFVVYDHITDTRYLVK
jgi:ribosome-binding ATPase YchF (GTP1/OBG family)